MRLSSLWPFGQKSTLAFAELPAAVSAGAQSLSGATVTASTALKVSTVFGCVRKMSNGVAQVPFKVYRNDGLSKLEALDHPLYDVLHRKPNGFMTSFALRETMMIHALLAGGSVNFVSRVGTARKISEIIPLDPGRVTCIEPKTLGDAPAWRVEGKNGESRILPAEAVWHIPGPSWDGTLGMDVIKLAREAIGLSIAAEQSQSTLHKKGVKPSGTYSVDDTLDAKQYTDLHKWISDHYSGTTNTGSPLLLDRGAKFTALQMTGVDAQHLETRRHQIEEVCRFFDVLPQMIGHSGQAMTFASAEQIFLAHVVHALTPWYERIEQSADCQLLTDAERRAGYYTKFSTAGLLRGALKDTADFLTKMVNGGIMTPNEARAKLELNPDGDPASDELRIPVNVAQPPGFDNAPTTSEENNA